MRRFLISRLSSLGDVVCSLPAAAALKDGVPGAHVTWVVDERFEGVVRCCSAIDEVVVWKRHGAIGVVRDALFAPWQRKDIAYEAALDLQGLLKSALVVGKVRATNKVGYHRQREGSALFSQRVLPDPSSIHVVDQYVDVARAVGGIADRAEFRLVPDNEATVSVRAYLNGFSSTAFIAVNPGSAHDWKRWPVDHFAALIDELPVPVVLIGSRGETGAYEIIERCRSTPLNLTGRTTIPELIALIGMAKAHVGGDTGTTHIAAALG